MNSKNSGTSDPNRPLINLRDRINLKRSGKFVALSYLSVYYKWKNIKSYNKNRFKTSAPAENEDSKLPGGSYSVSDIQDYLKDILKNYEPVTDNSSIMIYVNKMENTITFKIKTGYYLVPFTLKTMKLLGKH